MHLIEQSSRSSVVASNRFACAPNCPGSTCRADALQYGAHEARCHANSISASPRRSHGLSLFLRYLPPADTSATRIVLYVHGATFPSALSIAHRFDGRSWRDALCEAGFHVWGLDFLGFGESDRYPQMSEAPGRASAARPRRGGERAGGRRRALHPRSSWGGAAVADRAFLGHHAGGEMRRRASCADRPAGAVRPDRAPRAAAGARRRPPCPPGASSPSRTSGPASSRTCPKASRRCCRARISRSGASAISTAIPAPAGATRPASRFRPGRSQTSRRPGPARCPMIRRGCRRRSPSSAANGTTSSPTRMRAGCSTPSPPRPSSATSRSAAPPT